MSLHMFRNKMLRGASAVTALVVAAVGAAACTESPTSSATPATPRKVIATSTTVTRVKVLERADPLSKDITRSMVIGRAGGKFAVPEVGLTLDVPAGAVDRDVTFTATAKAGNAIAYDFGPAGSVFKLPIKFKQDLKHTTWYKLENPGDMQGAYYAADSQLDQQNAVADVNEFMKTAVDLKKATSTKVEVWVDHFSGYVIATGIRNRDPNAQ